MSFAHVPAGLRTAAGAVVFASAAAAVLVGGLALWTEFHLWLRTRGPPTLVLGLLFLGLGAVAFPLAAWVALRLVPKHVSRASLHLRTAGLLYGYLIAATAILIGGTPADELGGGDIALRASILVAAYAIFVSALVGWAAGPSRRESTCRTRLPPPGR
jgi:hypothetical protein